MSIFIFFIGLGLNYSVAQGTNLYFEHSNYDESFHKV
jgi:hypothetical protein